MYTPEPSTTNSVSLIHDESAADLQHPAYNCFAPLFRRGANAHLPFDFVRIWYKKECHKTGEDDGKARKDNPEDTDRHARQKSGVAVVFFLLLGNKKALTDAITHLGKLRHERMKTLRFVREDSFRSPQSSPICR